MNEITVTPHDAEQTGVVRIREAYALVLEEIRQVPSDDFVVINIDIPTAVTTTLGSLPEILSMRAEVEEKLPDFDSSLFEKLEPRVLALAHAQAVHMSATTVTGDLQLVAEAATKVRETLLSDVNALVQRKLLDGAALANLKGPLGYRNVAFDVIALAALLRSNWPAIAGKTAVELVELDRAETLAHQVLTALGLRDQGPTVVADASLIRQQSFTLFIKTYDQVRRAIHYLRWQEGDAEQIAPSLYAGRKRKGTSSNASEPEAPASDLVAAEPPLAAEPQPVDVPVGLPGGNPFSA